MKTTLSYEIIPETGKVSSSLGGRMRIKHNHLANAHGFGAFNPYNETCEHEKITKNLFPTRNNPSTSRSRIGPEKTP